MRTLVLGGIRSGKSRWAEAAIADTLAPCDTARYIATGSVMAGDSAWDHRVQAHRHRRAPWWNTVETTDVATQLRTDPQTPTLVDDLGCWLSAALDHRGWDSGSVDSEVADLLEAVTACVGPVVLVSPEVGLTVVPATAVGRRFADELGMLNQRLAQCCEQVVLVVAGQPVWVKPAAVKAPS